MKAHFLTTVKLLFMSTATNIYKTSDKVQKELQKLWLLSRFRGVRQDIFNLNRTILTLYLSYFNRKSPIKLEVPSYIIKNKRLANSFKEMVCFHAKR